MKLMTDELEALWPFTIEHILLSLSRGECFFKVYMRHVLVHFDTRKYMSYSCGWYIYLYIHKLTYVPR